MVTVTNPARWLGILCAAALAANGCKPKPPQVVLKRPDGTALEAPPPPKQEDEDKARALASEIKTADSKGDTVALDESQTELFETLPGTDAAAERYESLADAARDGGRIGEAIQWYEKLLFYRPNYERVSEVRRKYAQVLLASARYEDAANMLHALFENATDAAERVELGTMLADAWQQAGRARDALEIHVALRNTPDAPKQLQSQATDAALEMVSTKLSFSDAEALWNDISGDQDWRFLHPVLAYKLAKVYYHTRAYERSEKMLELVATRYADSTFGEPARDFLERLKNRFEVEPNTVGVMLPLSGKYKQYGERSLAAIKLAFGLASPIRLIVKDTEGDPTVAARVVEELVLDEHVLAIVGPLFSKTGMAACIKAEELSVPILTLSHREGLPDLGPWVFRTALTVRTQAKALARVAFEDLGFSNFALLYPQSRYGNEFMQAFWDEVDSRKGEVRAVESYERDQTTYFTPVRKLVGRYYMSSRGDYYRGLREINARHLSSHAARRARDDLQKNLPPIVDFDAIIIPDSGRNIGLIAPALAVEDIVMTRDEKALKTIEKATGNKNLHPVTLMGASTWNSQLTVDACERYCEEAIFVDGYFPDNPDPRVRDFVSSFRESTGATPLLSEAQAFDTGGLLKWLLAAKPPKSRKELRDRLGALTGYAGVTGTVLFDEQGEMRKKLFTLTIEDRQIKLWQKPTPIPEG